MLRASRCTTAAARFARVAPLRRALCSAPSPPTYAEKMDDNMNLPPRFDEVLRGVGQVIFLNSPAAGTAVLAALTYGDPWLGTMAALGTISATASAHAWKADSDAISAGLMGYNGCLVGCAFSVFLGNPTGSLTTALATVAGAAATAPLASMLKPLCGSVPQFTLAFNFTTLTALFAVQPLKGAAAADPATTISAMEWLCSPLVGVSQIFVVNDALSGAAILGAIGMYSPMCAAHTLLGSCVGVATGLVCGAPATEIGAGLWGFNPALTSLAVSVFFVPSMQSYALATGSAAATALLFGGAKAVMGGVFGVPALTLPFCAVAAANHLLVQNYSIAGLALAAAPHSPERNAA